MKLGTGLRIDKEIAKNAQNQKIRTKKFDYFAVKIKTLRARDTRKEVGRPHHEKIEPSAPRKMSQMEQIPKGGKASKIRCFQQGKF